MSQNSYQLTCRVASALRDRLDELAIRLDASETYAHKGPWSRAEVIRFLLAKGVDALDEELDREEGTASS